MRRGRLRFRSGRDARRCFACAARTARPNCSRASAKQLAQIEISPSGQGLYFPLLDADLFLPALLEGHLGSKRWIAEQMGRAGAKRSSEVKARAACENGRLGGRPRKHA